MRATAHRNFAALAQEMTALLGEVLLEDRADAVEEGGRLGSAATAGLILSDGSPALAPHARRRRDVRRNTQRAERAIRLARAHGGPAFLPT